MNIFFNISHPAHVHFFKNTIKILKGRGHDIIIGARVKEFTIDLLNYYGISYTLLTKKREKLIGLIYELLIQQMMIRSVVKNHRIDMMLQISGIFNAPIGRMYGIPAVAVSDTENDIWANRVSFSLSRHVLSPTCFDYRVRGTAWKNQILYPGYHELAYLSPKYGPEKVRQEDIFLLRFVGWGAGHDIGEKSLSVAQKIEMVKLLEPFGRVFISSEAPLSPELKPYRIRFHPGEIHGFMAKCKMIVGESATMASEAACLGIPAVFISDTGRGYTTEQDQRYDLIRHFRIDQMEDVRETLVTWASNDLTDEWREKRRRMLQEKIEVTDWLVDFIEKYPDSYEKAHDWEYEKYLIEFENI